MSSRRHVRWSKIFAITTLILSISALAAVLGAPTPPVTAESAKGESLVILRKNELDTSHTFESILLLSEPRTMAEGRKACEEFGEVLLSSSSAALQDLPFLLRDYSNPKVRTIGNVWIEKGPSGTCQSFDVHLSQVMQSTTCDTLKYPVVCSNHNSDNHKNPFSLETPSGPIVGTRDLNSFRFLGIPYAKAPVGHLRFKSPQAAEPFTAPFDASKFGFACPQNSASAERDRLNRATSSEDCLFLNVFTPVATRTTPSHEDADSNTHGSTHGDDDTELATVIVYLHGGGLSDYASSMVYFEPGNLVSRSGVVFVSLNYRLGLFGTMESEEQIPRSILPGNQAFRDQILALQWVQKNIAAFGGDPKKVTIMGESAGAVCIRALLSIPEAFPLYRSVISQSDSPGIPFNLPKITSGIVGTFAVQSLNCSQPTEPNAMFDCLLSKTTDEIMTAQHQALQHQAKVDPHYQPLLLFSPTIDGDLLSIQFHDKVFAHYKDQSKPLPPSWQYNTQANILWGSTSDEVGIVLGSKVIPVSGFDSYLRGFFHDSRTNLLESWPGYKLDPSVPDTVRITMARIGDDIFFHCPLQAITEKIAQSFQNNLFAYRLYRGRRVGVPEDNFCAIPGTHRTCHFDDVIPSLGSASFVDQINRTQVGDDARLSRILVDRFTTFAKTGNPNPDVNSDPGQDSTSQPNLVAAANPDLVGSTWPSYNPSSMALFDINLKSQVRKWVRRPTCRWLEEKHLYFEN
ncbi:hypothetical protein EMPS_01247 [Entomortierella parvispora]|uniref:Carboxylesterase type B domain-containing protein n=1 Tax=Entomortierella parvispora TaxID=205924 RepID=A0A9P3H2G4_9FUNG|nr:hypothetical protein EMPS_01247 [Entomortierella parvispora]